MSTVTDRAPGVALRTRLRLFPGVPRAGGPGASRRGILLLMALLLPLASCRFPGSVDRTIKIGLSAPFEGRYRDLGYEALAAVRLAVRQRNEAGGVGGSYLVELVALNDLNEPQEAVQQAREMAVDPGILGVLGGWSPGVIQQAAPEYERLGLAFLCPETDWPAVESVPQPPAEADFVAEYQALSGGVPPGEAALWAYAQANRLLEAIEEAALAEGRPTRQKVRALLATD